MGRHGVTTRRALLGSLGAGTAALLAGCGGADEAPSYERGTVDAAGGDPRTAAEMVAAAALAETEANEAASPLARLSLDEHGFVLEDGYKGPTVQGRVTNTGDDPLAYVEVRVRAYGADGAHLGRFLDSTGDLSAGTTWRFEAVLLVSAADLAAYEVAALGVPD